MRSLTCRWQLSLCTHSCGPHAGGGGAGHAGGGGGGSAIASRVHYCTRVVFVQGVAIGRKKCH